MFKKIILIFVILFFLFGFNTGTAEERIPLNEIPLTEIPHLWPLRGGLGTVTMFYGDNRHPITGQAHFHNGIDISTYRSGDAVVATADGFVITAEYDSVFGNFVLIEHKHGFQTFYAHMRNSIVEVGESVYQGEIIGYTGSTGISTGPHLHYEIRVNSEPVDPLLYINR